MTGFRPVLPDVRITRRSFLAGAAAVPATEALGLSSKPVPDHDYEILFDLSGDQKLLSVRRITRKKGLPKELQPWLLEIEAFGPKAFFDLDFVDGGSEPAVLAIRDVGYGGLSGATISLKFKRLGEPNATAWCVGLDTNVWLSASGKRTTSGVGAEKGARLDDLAHGNGQIPFELPAARVNSTLDRIFDSLLIAKDTKCAIHLDRSAQWTIGPSLSAFQGRIAAGPVTLGWSKLDPAGAARSLYGRGTVTAFQRIGFGDPNVIDGAFEADAGCHWLHVLGSADAPQTSNPKFHETTFSTLAWVEIAQGAVGVGGAAQGVERLPLTEAVLTQALRRLGKDRRLRSCLFGIAGPRRDNMAPTGTARPDTEFALRTRIGRMTARRSRDADQPDADAAPPPATAGLPDPKQLSGLIRAALGDRSGIPASTFYLLADHVGPLTKPASALRRVSAALYATALDTALPDTSHSRLTFENSRLDLTYTDGTELFDPKVSALLEVPYTQPPSFLWLGPSAEGRAVARLDLLPARLEARRDADLVDLAFRFADFLLEFTPQAGKETGHRIRFVPRDDTCRVMLGAGGEIHDNRPVLSVEFAPQHVLEEAFYQVEPPPLPDAPIFDVMLKDIQVGGEKLDVPPEGMANIAAILEILDRKPLAERPAWLRLVRARKIAVERGNDAATPPKRFAAFAARFEAAAGHLPEDQRIYIGPYGLDPDAMLLARTLQQGSLDEDLKDVPVDTLDAAAKYLAELLHAKDGPGHLMTPPADIAEALERERRIENALPLYRLWRDIWREARAAAVPGGAAPREYLMDGNHPKDWVYPEGKPGREEVKEQMRKQLHGNDEITRLAQARLSGRSFLAFRMNCLPAEGDSAEANDLGGATASPAAPGGLGTSFGGLDFSLAALTDWSHHEPAVTRRARLDYLPTPSGQVLPVRGRQIDIDQSELMHANGISRGVQTSAQRMREVAALMNVSPTPLETRIEAVSRLTLSTSQAALWRTSRHVDFPHNSEAADPTDDDLAPGPEGARSRSAPLWTARLVTSEAGRSVDPGLRVVGSPDFRVGALSRGEFTFDRPGKEPGRERIPGEAAPPRGAYAPWLIGRDQWDGEQIIDECAKPPGKLSLFDWICLQFAGRQTLGDLRLFRSSLDAYDRHELVLLSSSFGLPILPSPDGSQFVPAADDQLIDGGSPQAVYVSRPLEVKELSLTALGASFSHDTAFAPPSPLQSADSSRQPMFDGLSIERWQHQTVLGRDILATVVYAGYLFPFGHRASLVKVTERVFRRVGEHGMKAPLRQRMFIHISDPDKSFPAVGQPNVGRAWVGKGIHILTRTTPDIVDPMVIKGRPGQEVDLNGRIRLERPGLAFWPKTSLSESGHVSFDLEIDGQVSSVPLIFVDKVAIQHAESVGRVADYYNSLFSGQSQEPKAPKWPAAASPLVTMDFGGQNLEYAPPLQNGDTLLSTRRVVIQAEGRRRMAGDQHQLRKRCHADIGEPAAVLSGARRRPDPAGADRDPVGPRRRAGLVQT